MFDFFEIPFPFEKILDSSLGASMIVRSFEKYERWVPLFYKKLKSHEKTITELLSKGRKFKSQFFHY